MNLRTDYQKLEHRKKAGPLTARQLWKLKHLSYLKPFYKQCHKSVQGSGAVGGAAITSTDDDQEPEHDDRGHESSSSSRKETPTKIPVLSSPLPLCKPKKRRETEKEEKSSSFNEIMEVMKESASHLVTCARTVNERDRERESFFQWLNEFTSRMPWRNFQMQSIQLVMQFMPADSPQSKSTETMHITGSFCFIPRSTPNGPSAKTSTNRFCWLHGDATVPATVRGGGGS